MSYEQYKKQALKDLKSYNDLNNNIKVLQQRIKILKKGDIYTAPVTTQTRVMKSCDSDSQMMRHISQLEMLENKLSQTKLTLCSMDNALAMLSAKERDILTSFYINRQRRSVTKLAEETFSDRSWLYRRAQKALEHYIFEYFGVTKEDFAA